MRGVWTCISHFFKFQRVKLQKAKRAGEALVITATCILRLEITKLAENSDHHQTHDLVGIDR